MALYGELTVFGTKFVNKKKDFDYNGKICQATDVLFTKELGERVRLVLKRVRLDERVGPLSLMEALV